MNRYLFTYGSDHVSRDGHPGLKRATLIEGEGLTYDTARGIQIALHGRLWAFQYAGSEVDRLLGKYYSGSDVQIEHVTIDVKVGAVA